MARPVSISSERILSAAREVFLEEGFSARTTEIARRAGISEGTIFKRFPTKQALFAAAMGADSSQWTESLPERIGRGELRDNLVQIALEVLSELRTTVPAALCAWGSRTVDARGDANDELAALSRYFEAEMKLGRLKVCEPGPLARTFFAALLGHAVLELTGAAESTPLSDRNFARTLVDSLLAALGRAQSVGEPRLAAVG